MRKIHNQIKDYHWLTQAIIWGMLWFIFSTALTALMLLFIQLLKAF